MAKNYSNILKDIDTIIVAANAVNGAAGNVDATGPLVFPMKYFGFLSEPNQMKIAAKARLIREGGGSNLQKGYDFKATSEAFEMLNGEAAVVEKYLNTNCDIYLFGRDQVHRIKSVFPEVQIVGDLGVKDKQTVSLMCNDFPTSYADNLELNGVNTTYLTTIPQKYKTLMESIYRPGIVFETYPYLGAFNQTTKLFDASASRVAGSLFNTPVWSAAPIGAPYQILTFDGVSMYADFGSILNDDGVSDLLIEIWFKPVGADGSTQKIFTKKNSVLDNTAGFGLYRFTNNSIRFIMSNGTLSATFVTASTNNTQNIWKHFAISIARSGNMQGYTNGAVDGTAVSVASITTGTNAYGLRLAADQGGSFGNVAVAAVRVSNYGVGGLPSNVASIISQNFNAERTILGV